MTDFDTLFIGGHWTTPSTEETLEVFSPATEARVGSTPVAAPADIDAAQVGDVLGGLTRLVRGFLVPSPQRGRRSNPGPGPAQPPPNEHRFSPGSPHSSRSAPRNSPR